MHFIHGRASHIWLCISYISVHPIYSCTSHVGVHLCISYMVVHLIQACTYIQAYQLTSMRNTSYMGAHFIGMHLKYRRVPYTQACIPGIGVHLRYGRASQVWACTSGMGFLKGIVSCGSEPAGAAHKDSTPWFPTPRLVTARPDMISTIIGLQQQNPIQFYTKSC